MDEQPQEAPAPEDSRKKTQKNIGEIFGLTPWTTYLYFLRPLEPRPLKKIRHKQASRIILNAVYLKPDADEKRKIRDIWTKVLGVDVWYPYFKAKEIEDWMKERISFGFKKMKCKPKFIKNSFSYVCKKTF
jgi:hypothetical protein